MKKLLLSLSLAVATMFAASADTFVKVTDASTLAAGDEIIIVDKDGKNALSTTQNANNRKSTAVTVVNGSIVPGSDVQVITLEASGNSTYPWLLNVGANSYLYAPSAKSSGQNYLKTTSELATTANFSISIADGIATVKANNQYANTIKFNSTLFSCYTSGQTDIAIYAKAAEAGEKVEFTALPEEINFMVGEKFSLGSNFPENFEIISLDDEIATIDENNMVVAIAAGKTTLMASWEADEVYAAGEAEIAVVVTPYVQASEVTFDFVNKYADYGLEASTTNNITRKATIEVNGITLNLNGKWVLWNADKTLRCYKSDNNNAAATLEFIAPAGYNIIKIDANVTLATMNYEGEACEADWEGKAAMVELEVNANTTIKTIIVSLEAIGGAAEDPEETLDYNIVIVDSEGETLSGVIGSHDLDSVESFKIFFSQTNAEGISFYYMLTEATEVETLAAEPAEGYTLYNNEEGIVIPNNYNGTLSYYAQDDATEAKTDIKTISIDPSVNTSGVAAIEIDAANGAVEYFNLQGVRVNAPAAGLYLMRQGDKVMKVVIR